MARSVINILRDTTLPDGTEVKAGQCGIVSTADKDTLVGDEDAEELGELDE